MNGAKTTRLDAIAERVASKCSVATYEYESKEGSVKGDNYVGKILKLKLRDKKRGDERYFVAKLAFGSPQLREKMPIRSCFEREIYFYDIVMGKLEGFQKRKGVTPLVIAPKCYDTELEDGKESLVLEDLNELGYRMFNRKDLMDEEHIKLVLRKYGKFHAVSFAMKDQVPEEFEELTKNYRSIFEKDEPSEEERNFFIMQLDGAKKLFDPNTEKNVIDALECIKGRSEKVMKEMREEGKFNVITHGDCWCNNMMFKYPSASTSANPQDVILLDFQLSFRSSVVSDLAYFLYCCGSKKVFDELDRYLKYYHNALSSYLEELGSDAHALFRFEDLKEDWRKFCVFGFLVSMMVIRVMLYEADEVPDLEKVFEGENKNILEIFQGNKKDPSEKYKMRIKELTYHLVDSQFI